MGRGTTGMEHDGPIADARKMPSFISSLEEGRGADLSTLSVREVSAGGLRGNLRDLSRRVSRSNSRLSLDGGEREPRERSGEDGKDAKGNDNNCGAGGQRRRASAVEILRRNLGVPKSPSLRLNTSGRTQRGAEDESQDANVGSDAAEVYGRACGGFSQSDAETGDAGIESEPTASDPTSDLQRVVVVSATGHSRHGDGKTAAASDSFNGTEHVYCSVYCIASDSHQQEIRDDGTGASDGPGFVVGNGHEAGSSPELAMYTLDDLADPLGRVNYWLSGLQAGEETALEICRVCLEEKSIAPLPCCRKAVCDACLKLYVSSQVQIPKSDINCPITECSGYLEEGLVISHLANEDVAKYRYFLELSQLDSDTKPCPQCSQFTSLKDHKPNRSEHKHKIQCSNCQFVWCFKCHAPWHNGLKCRDYRKGDKLLRTWANVMEHGQRNAQKCPQCKIHIQRTEGCDHMICTQCNTNFCYRCGERYRHLRFFGDHTSNLSVFGCKYRYLPDKPHLRRLIRGSICASKVLIAPVVILLVIVFGALALVIGLVVFPVYYVCKRRRKNRTEGSGRWI